MAYQSANMKPFSKVHCTSVISTDYYYCFRFQSGAYLCIGKNNVPPMVSKRVQLYVDFPPTLWITHQLVGVPLGGVATIECLTAAHPKSLNFWHNKFGQFINQK